MDSWYWSCSPGNGMWRSLNSLNWILAQTNWNHFRLFITETILAIYNYQVNGVYSLIILYHRFDLNLSNLTVQKTILDLIPSREGIGLDTEFLGNSSASVCTSAQRFGICETQEKLLSLWGRNQSVINVFIRNLNKLSKTTKSFLVQFVKIIS